MYRIYMLCSNNDREPDIKCYWNNRLNKWTFTEPTLFKYLTALTFVVNKYLCKEHIEVIEDSINYYYYGIEEVK